MRSDAPRPAERSFCCLFAVAPWLIPAYAADQSVFRAPRARAHVVHADQARRAVRGGPSLLESRLAGHARQKCWPGWTTAVEIATDRQIRRFFGVAGMTLYNRRRRIAKG